MWFKKGYKNCYKSHLGGGGLFTASQCLCWELCTFLLFNKFCLLPFSWIPFFSSMDKSSDSHLIFLGLIGIPQCLLKVSTDTLDSGVHFPLPNLTAWSLCFTSLHEFQRQTELVDSGLGSQYRPADLPGDVEHCLSKNHRISTISLS